MSVVSILCGIALLCWTIVDIFFTVFVIGGGAGIQSRRVADWLWRGSLRMHRPSQARSHSLLRCAGPLIVLFVLVVWFSQLIAGWALIFVPEMFTDSSAVVIDDRIVIAGRAVVGRGGNTPALTVIDGPWELLRGLAGLSGVTLVSIGLAYVLPVLAGVAAKRAVSVHVHALGDTVEDMRELAKARADGGQLELHLIALVAPISVVAERHRAYPVLHYFHSSDLHAALAPAVTRLVLLTRGGFDESEKIDLSVTRPLNRAIRDLLDALSNMGLDDYATRNGCTTAEEIEELGLDPRSSTNTDAVIGDAALRAYVNFDGWNYDDIIQSAGDANRVR